MADIIRSPKSGNDWTQNELDAYNITIVAQCAKEFFGTRILRPPMRCNDLLSYSTVDEMENDDTYQVARYMDLAMHRTPGEESAVIDFVMQLLRTTGFAKRTSDRDLRSRKDIPFLTCGEWRHAKTDVCVVSDSNEILLLVQEDKRHLELGDPQPCLIAAAIAAFQSNNMQRASFGLDPLDFKEIPGIVMAGTSPEFFKIPVALELAQSVQRAQYPDAPTIVTVHRPKIPRPHLPLTEGMKPLDSRYMIFACLGTFRRFID